jgi:transposase
MKKRIAEEAWQKLWPILLDYPAIRTHDEEQCRRFVEAIYWIMRAGAPWRFLPEDYGNWNSVYIRYARWCELGVWQKLFEEHVLDPDMEELMMDSTIVRAHACAAGAKGGKTIRR